MIARNIVPVVVSIFIVATMLGASAQLMGDYNQVRFSLLFTCSAVVVIFLWRVGRPSPLTLAGYIIFIAAGFISLLLNDRSSPAFADWFQYAVYFAAIWLLASAFFDGSEHDWARSTNILLSAVGVGLGVYALLALLTYGWFIGDGGGALHQHFPFGFIHRRLWSHLATWSLPLIPTLLLWLSRNHASPVTVWALRIAAGIWVWILAVSVGRGSLVAIAAAMIFVALAMGASGRLALREMLKIGLLGMLAWLVLSYAVPQWIFETGASGRDFHATTSGRIGLWLRAWDLSLLHFPFGVGPLGWPTESSTVATPHSMLWVWASEWGWLSIAALLLIVGPTVQRWLKLRRHVLEKGATDFSLQVTGLTASVVAALMHSQVSGVLTAPWSMFLGFWVLALFIAVVWRPTGERKDERLRKHSLLSKSVRTVVAAVFLSSGWYAVVDYHSKMKEYNALNEAVSKKPRFWIDGRVPFRESNLPISPVK